MVYQLSNTIALSAIAAVLATPLAAEAKPKPHHAVRPDATAAELKKAQTEIDTLQARLTALEARIDQQGSAQQAVATQATTQAEAATHHAGFGHLPRQWHLRRSRPVGPVQVLT